MLFKTVIISMLAAVALAAPVATGSEHKARQDLGGLLGGVTGAAKGDAGAKQGAGTKHGADAGHAADVAGASKPPPAVDPLSATITGIVGGLIGGGLRHKK